MNGKLKESAYRWIQKADNDLKNVKNNLTFPEIEIPSDTLCFHCQQAAEKYFKAFLTFHEKDYPFSHNLGGLVRICMEVDSSFNQLLIKAEILTPYAVEFRYPSELPQPSLADAKEAYQLANEIKEFVINRMDS
ncbi:MAG: HEPN domain-containing protein [Brevinematales bacterium]|nr:HEPN domain-containing protein [Brevinematales bacterium]